MFAVRLAAEWAAWVAARAAPLRRRCAWRLAHVVAGVLLASGRRTASSWWRAAGIGRAYRSYYYFLDAVGRKAAEVATAVLGLVLDRVAPEGRLLLAIDDTPPKRYGPQVQGAGSHHNPTPGPAGSKFLYGQSWVVLGRVVHHPHGGSVALPLLGRLYIRGKDIPDLPDDIEWAFRTKPQLAAEAITWAGDRLGGPERRPWVAVDGAYCNREFLKPAKRAGVTVVARLRRDADLNDLPPPLKPGQKRGRGRPPIHGKDAICPARRAGQRRGWRPVRATTTRGRELVRMAESFLATWRPAGGAGRVVIVEEPDGGWRAYLCTDPEASVEAIVQAIHDRWAVEQGFADLKEVEGVEQVQLRRAGSNGGALNLNLWVHTLVEVWAWERPAEEVRDRRDRPWDDPQRRPSHADRRRALQREMVGEQFRRVGLPSPWAEKIRPLVEGVVRMGA